LVLTEGENFAKEYPMLAQNYLLERKNKFLKAIGFCMPVAFLVAF